MSAIIKEVYDAFIDAGVAEEKASAAAKTVTDYDRRFNEVGVDLLLVKWMLGVLIAVETIPLLKTWLA